MTAGAIRPGGCGRSSRRMWRAGRTGRPRRSAGGRCSSRGEATARPPSTTPQRQEWTIWIDHSGMGCHVWPDGHTTVTSSALALGRCRRRRAAHPRRSRRSRSSPEPAASLSCDGGSSVLTMHWPVGEYGNWSVGDLYLGDASGGWASSPCRPTNPSRFPLGGRPPTPPARLNGHGGQHLLQRAPPDDRRCGLPVQRPGDGNDRLRDPNAVHVHPGWARHPDHRVRPGRQRHLLPALSARTTGSATSSSPCRSVPSSSMRRSPTR